MKAPFPLLRQFLVAVLFPVLGCQSVPVPAPGGETSGLLGVQVRTVRFESGESTYPDRAWWVRLEPEANPLTAASVIESNYHRGQSVYLLNAEPGRYALVACGELRDGKTDFTYLSADAIRESMVELQPGKSAFTGLVQVRRRLGIEPHLKEMLHYAALVNPSATHADLLQSIFPRHRSYRATECRIERGARRTESYEKQARRHLGEAGWEGQLD